jgi:acyl-CoA dehydrogenase
MMFQAAECLRRSDAGDQEAYALTRLLTPLIKFRACRDARKVTGDAMEVRGGCGYIEEWGDARVLRDAHLGSIWEGTSNIVALDVMRAIQRENALHFETLLEASGFSEHRKPEVKRCITSASEFGEIASQKGFEHLARQAASGLYHLSAAISMAWEAAQIGSKQRQALADLALIHKIQPRDPLGGTQEQTLMDIF